VATWNWLFTKQEYSVSNNEIYLPKGAIKYFGFASSQLLTASCQLLTASRFVILITHSDILPIRF
jgi:hypothetical protein